MSMRDHGRWSAVGSKYHAALRSFSEVSDVPAGIQVSPAEVPLHDR
jgi:hypothetical protein